MRRFGLFLLIPLFTASSALAEATPRRGTHDPRVRIATYQEGQVFRLNVSLTHVTTIEFGEGETIRSILAGDTEGFELDGVPGGQVFAIKPLAARESACHGTIKTLSDERRHEPAKPLLPHKAREDLVPTTDTAHQHNAARLGFEHCRKFLSELPAEAEAAYRILAVVRHTRCDLFRVALRIGAQVFTGLGFDERGSVDTGSSRGQRGKQPVIGRKAGPQQQRHRVRAFCHAASLDPPLAYVDAARIRSKRWRTLSPAVSSSSRRNFRTTRFEAHCHRCSNRVIRGSDRVRTSTVG